mgnify:CR=1 FL=1
MESELHIPVWTEGLSQKQLQIVAIRARWNQITWGYDFLIELKRYIDDQPELDSPPRHTANNINTSYFNWLVSGPFTNGCRNQFFVSNFPKPIQCHLRKFEREQQHDAERDDCHYPNRRCKSLVAQVRTDAESGGTSETPIATPGSRLAAWRRI